MTLTLLEASKLSRDTMRSGIIDTVTTESALLSLLPFIPVVGNSLVYNRLNAAPTAAFYDVGDTWAEGTPTFTQIAAALKILGGDADVDNFLQTTRADPQDLTVAVLTQKANAVRRLMLDTFINGNSGANPNSFDGLERLTIAGQTVSMGAAGATLTLDKLDEMLDLVRGGAPTVIQMSRRSRRKMTALARAAGTVLETHLAFGTWQTYYNGIPIEINDYISDAQTVGASTDCSTIYASRLDANDGLCGIAALQMAGDPSSLIQIEDIGSLETMDAKRWRVKSYMSLVLFSEHATAKLTGVRP